MKRIITLYHLLILSIFSVAAQTQDTLYIYRTNGDINRIAISSIDSMSFIAPSAADDTDTPGDYEEPIDTITHPVAVDLGLSLKWASCNIGASSPLELGSFFAWGEVEEKDTFTLENYKWYDESNQYYNKYCPADHYVIPSGEGYTWVWTPFCDNKGDLEPEDDVVKVKWGDNWRMPKTEDVYELYRKCTIEPIYRAKKVIGFKIIGPNGNSIIIPYHEDPESNKPLYWLNDEYYTMVDYNVYKASMNIDIERNDLMNNYPRWRGLPVRPVCE